MNTSIKLTSIIPSNEADDIKVWLERFKNLSPRICIRTHPDPRLIHNIYICREITKMSYSALCGDEPDISFTSCRWPSDNDIICSIAMDSSFGGKPQFLGNDVYFLCTNRKGFKFSGLNWEPTITLEWQYIWEQFESRLLIFNNYIPQFG